MNSEQHGAICLSFDIDWAEEFILEDLANLLSGANVPATFFATHESDEVQRLLATNHAETGLHPNFFLNQPNEEVFADLKQKFPQAKGVRNHVLYYHSRLLPLFHAEGVRYLSNDLQFLREDLHTYYDWSGMVRLPIFWEDDVHCIYFDQQFDLDPVINKSGLKVFNFHPVHIFLNTSEFSDYENAKASLKDANEAKKHQRSGPGVRTFFEQLLKMADRLPIQLLIDVAEDFRKNNQYAGHFDRFVGDG